MIYVSLIIAELEPANRFHTFGTMALAECAHYLPKLDAFIMAEECIGGHVHCDFEVTTWEYDELIAPIEAWLASHDTLLAAKAGNIVS